MTERLLFVEVWTGKSLIKGIKTHGNSYLRCIGNAAQTLRIFSMITTGKLQALTVPKKLIRTVGKRMQNKALMSTGEIVIRSLPKRKAI